MTAKNSAKSTKQTPKTPATPTARPAAGGRFASWAVLAVCLLGAGGGTWAFCEFVVWNNLPGELVGRWEVVQGPPEYKEAEFEFYRSGKMVGRFNDNGRLRIMNAEVEVHGDKLHVITRRPSTGEKHVAMQTIRTMNDREFVVADERGEVLKMVVLALMLYLLGGQAHLAG